MEKLRSVKVGRVKERMIRSYDVGSLPIGRELDNIIRGAKIYTSILPFLKDQEQTEVQNSSFFEKKILQVFLDKLSSGIDVPTDTRVRPIINSETPSFFAILEADSTK